MTKIIPLRPFSYSRASADEFCERSRYLGSEWGGTGLSSIVQAFELEYGNVLHRQLEFIGAAQQWAPDQVAAEIKAIGKKCGFDALTIRDWTHMAWGHLIGFQQTIEPSIRAEYDTLETEKMRLWELEPGHVFRYRQDRLLRNRHDGHKAYYDYKTTGSNRPEWVASWAKSVQLHSSLYAMRKQGVDVDRARVIGFYKGYHDDKKNIRRSPFTYCWHNQQTDEYSYTYERGSAWDLCAVADHFPSVDALTTWVAGMPFGLLEEQFPSTGPIFLRDDIAETWFRQQRIREREVAVALARLSEVQTDSGIQAILDAHFRQDFSRCDPPWGHGCEFEQLCWQRWVEADPIGSRLFIRREKSED